MKPQNQTILLVREKIWIQGVHAIKIQVQRMKKN